MAGRRLARLHLADRSLIGRIERAKRLDLVPEELDPDRQRQRWREHVDDPAASGELATAGDLEDRDVAKVEEVAKQRVLVDPTAPAQRRADHRAGPSGAIVCCRSAWTLATRTRARPPRHAASAATRAAVSSATSSLRS